MKCDKCGLISFDHNLTCPSCNRDLSLIRSKLGMFWDPPETSFDDFFAEAASGLYRTTIAPPPPAPEAELEAEGHDEAELDLDTGEDEFEFTLDD